MNRSTPAPTTNARRLGGVPAEVMVPRILFMLTVLALVLIGIVMVFSASSVEAITEGSSSTAYVVRQVLFAAAGLVGCAVCALIPYRKWLGVLTAGAWIVAVVLIVMTAVMGTEALGATRWIVIGGFGLQPSEFAKIAFVLVAARTVYLYREGQMGARDLIVHVTVGLLLPLGALFITQSDFGTTAICIVSILAVMWAGDVPGRTMLVTIAIVAVAGVIGICSSSYRLARMTSFLDPWGDGEGGLGTGYQLVRSFYAFAEGGLFGVGLGNSSEKFTNYLPEAETDFIFAVIGEELGMVGALAIVGLFLLLLYSGLRIARTAPDNFGAMIACGITTMIVFQAFLNMACVIGMAPTTGKPLPFISSGGSSLIASLLMAGLVLGVSLQSGAPDEHDRRRADLRIVRPERTDVRASASAGASRGRRETSSHGWGAPTSERRAHRGAERTSRAGSSRDRSGRGADAYRQRRR